MFDPDSLPTGPEGPAPDLRLAERVLTRIKHARRDVQRRSRKEQVKGRGPRAVDHDARALRRVFLDLGESYRSYRRRTGEPVVPEVREAALRFRRELDLTSLVSVAASLDRVDHDLVG
jgi:hypothetical protein